MNDELFEYVSHTNGDDGYVYYEVEEEDSRIALCTLSAINWGKIKKPEDFKKPCDLAVRALDNLLSYQDYPMVQAELATEEFRTLGIGIINLAYFLAKNNVKYDDSAFELVDEYMEAMSYYLIKASVELAKEKGACKLSHETKYGMGIFPHETAKNDVNELVPLNLKQDWEALRKDLKEYGIRNATLMALMPSESSSQLSGATNGVEPPRALVSEKASKDGILKMVVPEYYHLRNKYDLLWDQKTPEGYLKIMAILQRYIDQTISTNTSYNPEHFSNGKIPMEQLISHLVMCYKYGIKTLYYNNTNDGATDDFSSTSKLEDIAEEESEQIEEECDSCIL